MKVVITGGMGFIGARLGRALCERGRLTGVSGQEEPVDELVLFDSVEVPGLFEEREGDTKVTIVVGDISDGQTVRKLVDRDDISVFHLASVVSGAGEKDFDLAMRVNLDGGRHLLEALRMRDGQARLVFASSLAVFGGTRMPHVVGDNVKQTSQTTYGITKSMCELMINDYTRKGFIDGRSARLPTVIIRPGKPNQAASSFVSGVFREPLNGEDFELPVAVGTVMPILGYRAIVDNLIRLHELNDNLLSDDRAVSLPSHTVAVQDMIDALNAAAGNRGLGQITVKPDPFIEQICAGWPQDCEYSLATSLGFTKEDNLEEIVAYYIEDYL
jgi:nucleoside-diphosphate-sugar epimerase